MLLNSTADLKQYFGAIQANASFKTLAPYIQEAEHKYIIPAIGQDLFEELGAGITPGLTANAPSTITLVGPGLELYHLVGRSLANYAMLEAFPFLNLNIGDAGVQESSLQHNTPVRQWTFYKAEDAAANKADLFLDLSLEFLELNADSFPTWKASDAYTISKELFIPNVKELSRFINIHKSRRAYLAFKPYLQRAEVLYIAPELGQDLFDDLKEAQLAGTLTAEQKGVLVRVYPALAHFALAEAVPELAIQVSAGGYKVLSENDSIKSRLAANESQVASIGVKSRQLADRYMAELRRHLDTVIQSGETDPADLAQTWEAPDNSCSPSFWV